MAAEPAQSLPLFSLAATAVGSMVGAGIFSLPRIFGIATGPFGAIIAWIMAGTGMYLLARVFQVFAEKRADIGRGILLRPCSRPGNPITGGSPDGHC